MDVFDWLSVPVIYVGRWVLYLYIPLTNPMHIAYGNPVSVYTSWGNIKATIAVCNPQQRNANETGTCVRHAR